MMKYICYERRFNGAKRDRTADLLLARQALSQLSYGPKPDSIGKEKTYTQIDKE
jgi:hypothetical protein